MKAAIVAVAAALVGACVSTQELPLAPNRVRLDTTAGGALFVGQAVPQTMRRAAEATLARGYTHFRFEDTAMQQGAEFAGTNVQVWGSGPNAFATATPVRRPTAAVGVTVVMFREGDPSAAGAFDARQILAQYR